MSVPTQDEILGCPHCHGPIKRETGGCQSCGSSWHEEGPVLNFLGDRAYLMPDRTDLAKATWLVAQWRRWDELPDGAVATCYHRLADETVTATDIERMVHGSTFHQIMNDIRRMQEGIAAPSPTVEFMLAHSQIGPDSVVLDVGCSAGRHLWELAPRSPRFLAGIDIQLFPLTVGALTWNGRAVKPRPLWCCGDALSLPFKDGVFSHINSFVTLSYVPIQKALAELARVLSPDGRLTLTLEGMGYWRRDWDNSRFLSRQRVHLIRRWLGERFLRWGFDWQHCSLLRRLSGQTQFTRSSIERVISRAGLEIETLLVLTEYHNQPLLYGLTVRKPRVVGHSV